MPCLKLAGSEGEEQEERKRRSREVAPAVFLRKLVDAKCGIGYR